MTNEPKARSIYSRLFRHPAAVLYVRGDTDGDAMKPGDKVNTPHGIGVLLTRCVKIDAWVVLFGKHGEIVLVEQIEVVE